MQQEIDWNDAASDDDGSVTVVPADFVVEIDDGEDDDDKTVVPADFVARDVAPGPSRVLEWWKWLSRMIRHLWACWVWLMKLMKWLR